MPKQRYKTTADIKVPKNIHEQVIGQDNALNIIKKAAKQRRHVLLIGESGTGKSMLGQSLAELLPKENLIDVLCLDNPQDENSPLIRIVPKGHGKKIATKARLQSLSSVRNQNILFFILVIITILAPWWIRKQYGDVMAAASLIGSMIFLAAFVLFINLGRKIKTNGLRIPKLLIDNSDKKQSPFLDGTGSHAGALLGDVLHDPLQSGGLGTPAYERVVPGLIHKASGGVLFIDEIGLLTSHSQQELLTAMQEKRYPITGQSERSSGAMVRTEPVPTDFVLVAAGTLDTIKRMHPALRSRIRGYGYEVYINHDMPDNLENKNKIVRFIAQEVVKDKKIAHFTKEAAEEIITEAKKRAGTAGKLTLYLRELGGLIRAAGDLALEDKSKFVERKHVIGAKTLARTLEQQIADKFIEQKKEYDVIITKGTKVGRVNGLAVIGSGNSFSGIILPIEAEVTPGGKKAEFVATGRLGEIAKEAVKNVSAIVLKYFGEDIKEKHDIFVQFIQTADSGVEGDSASIAVATAIISALKDIPIKQNTAMTGSLSIRGEVLAVGGITSKIEAAIEAGISRVIIPKANEKDVLLTKDLKNKIKIIPVNHIIEVIKEVFDWRGKEKLLRQIIKK